MTVEVEYRHVVRALGRLEPAVQKQLKGELRKSVVEIVGTARGLASWSQKIPPAIVPTVTATGAGIRVKASQVPLAGLAERRHWRHPLFGNKNFWFPQSATASVRPAIRAHEASEVREMNRAVDRAARQVGLL